MDKQRKDRERTIKLMRALVPIMEDMSERADEEDKECGRELAERLVDMTQFCSRLGLTAIGMKKVHEALGSIGPIVLEEREALAHSYTLRMIELIEAELDRENRAEEA